MGGYDAIKENRKRFESEEDGYHPWFYFSPFLCMIGFEALQEYILDRLSEELFYYALPILEDITSVEKCEEYLKRGYFSRYDEDVIISFIERNNMGPLFCSSIVTRHSDMTQETINQLPKEPPSIEKPKNVMYLSTTALLMTLANNDPSIFKQHLLNCIEYNHAYLYE